MSISSLGFVLTGGLRMLGWRIGGGACDVNADNQEYYRFS